MTKRIAWPLAAAAGLWGVAADLPVLLDGDWGIVASMVVGPAFAVAGALAATRRPDNRTGAILLLTAFVWPIGSVRNLGGEQALQIATAGYWLWTIPLIYLVLAFPSGRLARSRDAWLCWLASVPALWLVVAEMPLIDFERSSARKTFLVHGTRPIFSALELVSTTVVVAAMGMLIARVREKWSAATPAGRRALAPIVITGSIALGVIGVVVLVENYVPVARDHSYLLNRVAWLCVAGVPIGFLVGLMRARSRRARVGDLVIELSDLPTPERFQDALRKALGDPALVAAFWVPDARRYLTAEGRPLTLPDEGSASVATFVERGGEPLAVIVHDRSLMDDPGLVAGATAAARLAVENERLQQEVVEQLMEVRASRRRIVQAGDEARKRLERDLHDGAQQRLVTLGLHLQRLESSLGRIDARTGRVLEETKVEVKGALADLRNLARGLHPLVLTEEGLGPALEYLCARFPLPVTIDALDIPRLAEEIETAAYFAVSEALANVTKHARATKVAIAASVQEDILFVRVADDGKGGASLVGSGLRGLSDRIQALEGKIRISSPTGAGTELEIELPTTVPAVEGAAPFVTELDDLLALVPRRSVAGDQTVLRVRDLDAVYGAQQVLFGVDLDVAAGEVVALLGTNGAGKSTLVRCLAGLHDPLRGSIQFNGVDINELPPEQRSRAGLVVIEGGDGVFAPLTAEENLRLFGRHAGVPLEDGLARAYEAFPELAKNRSQRAGGMSRGEQHMLALARGVMADASLVVVDELTLGLASDAVDSLCEHVRELNQRGSAILFVEQSADVASRLARRACFLDGGRVVFDGTLDALEASDLFGSTRTSVLTNA